MSLLQISCKLVCGFIEAALLLFTFEITNNDKRFIRNNTKKSLFFCMAYAIVSYFISTFVPLGFHMVFTILFSLAGIMFVTRTNIYPCILTLIVFLICMAVCESLIFIAEMTLLSPGLKLIADKDVKYLVHELLCMSIQGLFILFLFKKNINIFKTNALKQESSLITNYVLQAFFFCLFIFFANKKMLNPDNLVAYNIFLFAIFFIFSVIGIMDFKERESMLRDRVKLNQQIEQIKNLKSIINVYRKERHDYCNHLNAILAMCIMKRHDSLEKIEEYVRKITSSPSTAIMCFNTGNEFIDGFFIIKSAYARENNIEFGVDIKAPLSCISVDVHSLISILGNIIDNAFDAILGQPDLKDKYVGISTYVIKDKYYISVMNTGPKIPEEYIDKIYNKGFSTKTRDNDEHGYGLYIVKQLVEKNNGRIHVTSMEYNTEFTIEFDIGSKICDINEKIG